MKKDILIKESTQESSQTSIDPGIIGLAKLLARFAVEDYLEEINHPAARNHKSELL